MRTLMTTQYQNCYREQIHKEKMSRLLWKSRYSKDYPTCFIPRHQSSRLLPPRPPADTWSVLPPVAMATEKEKDHLTPALVTKTPPPVTKATAKQEAHLTPPPVAVTTEGRSLTEVPLMRPVSPPSVHILYHGKGRSQYLQRRDQKRPEEKYDFPLISSWEYGWKLGEYGVNYRSPLSGKSSVVKNTFYAKNGIFNFPSATDTLSV